MSIREARPGHITPAWGRSAIPDREFLEKTLAAIRKRRGLIHGSLMNGGGQVCALGAFAKMHDNTCINLDIAEQLQAFNDSMPKASKQTRRAKVIKWIEQRLRALPKVQ